MWWFKKSNEFPAGEFARTFEEQRLAAGMPFFVKDFLHGDLRLLDDSIEIRWITPDDLDYRQVYRDSVELYSGRHGLIFLKEDPAPKSSDIVVSLECPPYLAIRALSEAAHFGFRDHSKRIG